MALFKILCYSLCLQTIKISDLSITINKVKFNIYAFQVFEIYGDAWICFKITILKYYNIHKTHKKICKNNSINTFYQNNMKVNIS